jgi:hypothetical protein
VRFKNGNDDSELGVENKEGEEERQSPLSAKQLLFLF